MNARTAAVTGACVLGFLAACRDTRIELENPADPAAPNYSPPLPTLGAQSGLMVNDFDDANPARNLLGYCPRPFVDASAVAEITVSHTRDGAFRGQSLRIDFDVSGSGLPSGGYVEPLTGNELCASLDGPFNLAALRMEFLSFWIKSSSERVDVEVAIKDVNDVQTEPKLLAGRFALPSTAWQKVRIPLAPLGQAAGGRLDPQRLREVNFGFAKLRSLNDGLAQRGTVYLDEIAFER